MPLRDPLSTLNNLHPIRSGEVQRRTRSRAERGETVPYLFTSLQKHQEPPRVFKNRPEPSKASQWFPEPTKPSRAFQRRPAEDWWAGPNPKGQNVPNVRSTRTVAIFNRKRRHSSIFPANPTGGLMRGCLGQKMQPLR